VATRQSARACQDLSEFALAFENMVRSFLLLAARDDKLQLERPTRASRSPRTQLEGAPWKDTKKALLQGKREPLFLSPLSLVMPRPEPLSASRH
jgi:hypothetical protein